MKSRPAAEAQPPQTSGITDLVHLRRILVPIDFSDCSKNALISAVPLARQSGATLLVVHVIDPAYPSDPCLINQFEEWETSAVESSRRWLSELVARVVPAEVEARTFVRTGSAAGEIVEAASELQADLIILPTHGYTGLKHVVFGSTAENVVRHSRCPVLTLRAQA